MITLSATLVPELKPQRRMRTGSTGTDSSWPLHQRQPNDPGGVDQTLKGVKSFKCRCNLLSR